MLKAVEGIYRDGKVELLETPGDIAESRVVVTFLAPHTRTLAEAGLTRSEAEELRWRFQAFAEDWERPEMDVYDEK
jgi:hypothetical protein